MGGFSSFMELFAQIAPFAGFAVFVFGWFFTDYDESRRRFYYGQAEDHQWFNNPDGSLNRRNLFLFTALFHGGFLTILYLSAEYLKNSEQTYNVGLCAVGAWLVGAGLIHYFKGRSHIKSTAKGRVLQIAYRENLKRYIDRPQELFIRSYRTSKNGDMYVERVPWIKARTLEGLQIALTEWAAIPDSELKKIWVDLKWHPK